jgi:hypothetical protein
MQLMPMDKAAKALGMATPVGNQGGGRLSGVIWETAYDLLDRIISAAQPGARLD